MIGLAHRRLAVILLSDMWSTQTKTPLICCRRVLTRTRSRHVRGRHDLPQETRIDDEYEPGEVGVMIDSSVLKWREVSESPHRTLDSVGLRKPGPGARWAYRRSPGLGPRQRRANRTIMASPIQPIFISESPYRHFARDSLGGLRASRDPAWGCGLDHQCLRGRRQKAIQRNIP